MSFLVRGEKRRRRSDRMLLFSRNNANTHKAASLCRATRRLTSHEFPSLDITDTFHCASFLGRSCVQNQEAENRVCVSFCAALGGRRRVSQKYCVRHLFIETGRGGQRDVRDPPLLLAAASFPNLAANWQRRQTASVARFFLFCSSSELISKPQVSSLISCDERRRRQREPKAPNEKVRSVLRESPGSPSSHLITTGDTEFIQTVIGLERQRPHACPDEPDLEPHVKAAQI